MSSEKLDQVLVNSQKASIVNSQNELDVCKRLPDGFNASILSEFEDAYNAPFEQQRNLRSLSLQNSKQGEYGSVSQTRGNQGRWDNRSTGSSDKDGVLQSEQESIWQDAGKRMGNQTWLKNLEHGLLRKPTGCVGPSAPKDRGNGHYQLSRSTEPYQPPQPYKTMPYPPKDSTDLYNDETFGSAECSNEDRAEEERKRRVSFELMRKEQHKALQEKHRQNLDNWKENIDADIIALLGNSADGNSIRNGNKSGPSYSLALQVH